MAAQILNHLSVDPGKGAGYGSLAKHLLNPAPPSVQVPASMVGGDPVFSPNNPAIAASIVAANANGVYNSDPVFVPTPAVVASIAKANANGVYNSDPVFAPATAVNAPFPNLTSGLYSGQPVAVAATVIPPDASTPPFATAARATLSNIVEVAKTAVRNVTQGADADAASTPDGPYLMQDVRYESSGGLPLSLFVLIGAGALIFLLARKA